MFTNVNYHELTLFNLMQLTLNHYFIRLILSFLTTKLLVLGTRHAFESLGITNMTLLIFFHRPIRYELSKILKI